jgi:hypothetical protein
VISGLNSAKTDIERFYLLGEAAKGCFMLGKIEDARRYALELKMMAPNFAGDSNYGNATEDYRKFWKRDKLDYWSKQVRNG